MPGNYSHTTRATGTILTAAIYNGDHQNHIDNQTPAGTDDHSVNASQMATTTDPGEVGSESLATSLGGELERIRFIIAEMQNVSQWYRSSLKGTDIASAAGVLSPTTTGKFFDVTGSNGPITGLSSGFPTGIILGFRFTGGPLLQNNVTSFILANQQDYLVTAGDIFFFLHLGSGNWLEVGRRLAGNTAQIATLPLVMAIRQGSLTV
jgi:hypothetical protein